MGVKTNIVAVNFKNKHGGGYSEKEYHYKATTPLEVGQLVKVETKRGTSQVRVARVAPSEEDVPKFLRGVELKTITSDCVLLEADGSHCMAKDENLDLAKVAEDFFKGVGG